MSKWLYDIFFCTNLSILQEFAGKLSFCKTPLYISMRVPRRVSGVGGQHTTMKVVILVDGYGGRKLHRK